MLKVGRNDKCPCGSGKKYKKCCLVDPERNAEIVRAASDAKTREELGQILAKPMEIFQLKVELIRMRFDEMEEEVSRTFEMRGNDTLYDLHMNIQHAFEWDNDHMFSFFLGEKLWDRDCEYSANPLGEPMPPVLGKPTMSADDAELRHLGLSVGFSFWYLFDYGDELVHKVTVEGIREMTPRDTELLKIISKVGKAPPQYGEEEEEDENEDE